MSLRIDCVEQLHEPLKRDKAQDKIDSELVTAS